MVMLLVAVSLSIAAAQQAGDQGEEDPCSPNPCGENTLCYSNGGIIGCECVAGFAVPEAGDPFDGCFSLEAPPTRRSQPPLTPGPARRGEVVRESSGQAVQEPRSLEPEDAGQAGSRLQEGRRPGQLAPRRPAATSRPNRVYAEVDTKELFPDECLIHEDCEDSHFCNPQELKCHDACTLAVCGTGALCSSALHRPVCSCPAGYQGNPYDVCTKSPSRVGPTPAPVMPASSNVCSNA